MNDNGRPRPVDRHSHSLFRRDAHYVLPDGWGIDVRLQGKKEEEVMDIEIAGYIEVKK
jgi:hypothetical protein